MDYRLFALIKQIGDTYHKANTVTVPCVSFLFF